MNLSPHDAPAMLGVHPWDSQLSLFERLTTGADRRWWVKIAAAVEPALAEALLESQGVAVYAPWSDAQDWIEGPPRWLYAFAQQWLREHDGARCRVGVLGTTWHAVEIGADAAFADELAEAEDAFLAAVDSGEAPPPGPDDLDVVKRLWPDDDAGEIKLPASAIETWERIKALRRTENDAEKRRHQLEAGLRFALGAHAFGALPNGRRIRLVTQADRLGRVGRRLVEVR